MLIHIVVELSRSLTPLKLRKRYRGTLFGEIEQCRDIPLQFATDQSTAPVTNFCRVDFSVHHWSDH